MEAIEVKTCSEAKVEDWKLYVVSLQGKAKKTPAVRTDEHLKVGVLQIQRHHLVILSNGRHDCPDCLHLELGSDNILTC